MRGQPIDFIPRPSPQKDVDLYWRAQKDMEKLFPSELFMRFLKEFWAELAELDESDTCEQEAQEMADAFEQLYEEICSRLPAQQAAEIQNSLNNLEKQPSFDESECIAARSEYIQTWVDSLFGLNKTNQTLEGRRLNDNLWPPNVPPEYITLDKYLFSKNSISQVMSQFAANIKAAVDASPDGFLIMPRDSRGIELRIKKDAAGYYSA